MSRSPRNQCLMARCSRGRVLKPGCLRALGEMANDRDLRVAGIDQSLADRAEVVGRTAHTTGLGDGRRHLVRIVLAFPESRR